MTDVHIRRLRYALEVAERGSFTHAAAALHLSQQGLSHQIRKLEQELGFDLFARTTRSVVLTAAGARYLAVAREAVRELNAAAEAARASQSRRILRVGFLVGAAAELTDPILDDYSSNWPHVDVDLVDKSFGDSSAGLQDGSTDVAFVRAPMTVDGLTLQELAVEPRVVAMARTHPLAVRETIDAADVGSLPLVGVPSQDPIFSSFWSLGDALGTDTTSVIREAATLTEELQIVARGSAVSVTALAASRFLPWPGVVYRIILNCDPSRICVARRTTDDRPEVVGFLQSATSTVSRLDSIVKRIATTDVGQLVVDKDV